MGSSDQPGWFEIAPGILRRTIAAGAAMMQMEVRLEQGSRLPEHHHPHEQITHMLSGRLKLWIGGKPVVLGPGETVLIPGGVPHSAETIEEARVIDTFSPPREDLLAQDRRGQ